MSYYKYKQRIHTNTNTNTDTIDRHDDQNGVGNNINVNMNVNNNNYDDDDDDSATTFGQRTIRSDYHSVNLLDDDHDDNDNDENNDNANDNDNDINKKNDHHQEDVPKTPSPNDRKATEITNNKPKQNSTTATTTTLRNKSKLSPFLSPTTQTLNILSQNMDDLRYNMTNTCTELFLDVPTNTNNTNNDDEVDNDNGHNKKKERSSSPFPTNNNNNNNNKKNNYCLREQPKTTTATTTTKTVKKNGTTELYDPAVAPQKNETTLPNDILQRWQIIPINIHERQGKLGIIISQETFPELNNNHGNHCRVKNICKASLAEKSGFQIDDWICHFHNNNSQNQHQHQHSSYQNDTTLSLTEFTVVQEKARTRPFCVYVLRRKTKKPFRQEEHSMQNNPSDKAQVQQSTSKPTNIDISTKKSGVNHTTATATTSTSDRNSTFSEAVQAARSLVQKSSNFEDHTNTKTLQQQTLPKKMSTRKVPPRQQQGGHSPPKRIQHLGIANTRQSQSSDEVSTQTKRRFHDNQNESSFDSSLGKNEYTLGSSSTKTSEGNSDNTNSNSNSIHTKRHKNESQDVETRRVTRQMVVRENLKAENNTPKNAKTFASTQKAAHAGNNASQSQNKKISKQQQGQETNASTSSSKPKSNKPTFCLRCNAMLGRKRPRMHHAWCHLNQFYDNSGAMDIMERIRQGRKLNCKACEKEFSTGRLVPEKDIRHNSACLKNQKVLKKLAEEREEKEQREEQEKKRKRAEQRKKKRNDAKKVLAKPISSSLSSSSSSSSSEDNEDEDEDTDEASEYQPKQKRQQITTSSTTNLPLAGNVRGSSDAISNTVNQNQIQNQPPPQVTPQSQLTNKEASDDAASSGTKPSWTSVIENPWGLNGYVPGDVMLYGPPKGIGHIETVFSSKRYTVDPFKPTSNYWNTHASPEEGLIVLSLKRDSLATQPWGFRVSVDEFGRACLVESVDPLSPATAATHLGVPENISTTSLEVNDMIMMVNGKPVGGMTIEGLDVEIETSGSTLLLAISRYKHAKDAARKFAAMEQQVLDVVDSATRDRRLMGWVEIGHGGIQQPPDFFNQTTGMMTMMTGGDEQIDVAQHSGDDGDNNNNNNETDCNDPENLPLSQEEYIPEVEHPEARTTTPSCEEMPNNRSLTPPHDSPIVCKTVAAHTETTQSEEDSVHTPLPSLQRHDSIPSQSPEDSPAAAGRHQSPSINSENEAGESSDSENWEEDDNAWLGCVCGMVHSKSGGGDNVFWIQCDVCKSWYDVAKKCVGFGMQEVAKLKVWACWACPQPEPETALTPTLAAGEPMEGMPGDGSDKNVDYDAAQKKEEYRNDNDDNDDDNEKDSKGPPLLPDLDAGNDHENENVDNDPRAMYTSKKYSSSNSRNRRKKGRIGYDQYRNVHGRTTSEGYVMPLSQPLQRSDGTFQKPSGRGFRGMIWDYEKGLWKPR